MLQFLQEHQSLLAWLTGASVFFFVASLILVPWLILRIPQDYFLSSRRLPTPWANRHPLIRFLWRLSRNLLGTLFLAVGFLLLFMPGQGLLTMFIGLMMVDFPGKYRLERQLVRKGAILRALNWIRRKGRRPPLLVDGDYEEGA